MKILLISEECGTGSTGRICTDIAVECEKRGDTVKIAYGRNANLVPECYQKYAVRIGNKLDLIMHGVKARFFDLAGFGSTNATKRLIKWIKDYDPDVIHLHNIHGYYINVKILFDYLSICNKKIIWTLHDVWAFTGHSAYCDAVNCERWKTGCGNCPQQKVYPKSYVDRSERNWELKKQLFSNIDNMTIVTPSIWLADQVKLSFLSKYPVCVINNGIDTGRFNVRSTDYKKLHNLENKIVLLSVATVWNDLKGLSDFIELSKVLDERFVILLVGGMEKKDINILPSNIIYITKTQNIDEMVEIYNAADFYLNFTYCDTYPTVNLEAFSCGIKVITYRTGGSTEIVERFGGFVVDKGDYKAVKTIVETTKLDYKLVIPSNEIDKSISIKEYVSLYDVKLQVET